MLVASERSIPFDSTKRDFSCGGGSCGRGGGVCENFAIPRSSLSSVSRRIRASRFGSVLFVSAIIAPSIHDARYSSAAGLYGTSGLMPGDVPTPPPVRSARQTVKLWWDFPMAQEAQARRARRARAGNRLR